MVAIAMDDRRKQDLRRQTDSPIRFPFFDRHGDAVLWDRRKASGRRKSDTDGFLNSKDLPGCLIMAALFLVLMAAVYYVRADSEVLLQGFGFLSG